VAVRGQIASLERQLRSAPAGTLKEIPANPLQISNDPDSAQLQASIQALDERIKSKHSEQGRLEQQISTIQARIQLSPIVEEQFKELTRDHETALQIYNDLLTKKTQSEMVRDLEQRREGEQFHVMDAPALPSKPSWPDRQKFALAGLVSGFALGILLAALLEYKERFIRTEQDVENHLGLPVLIVIQDLDPR
jgi:uncharacterized protein involved in exopolysaccharide biosynthesis